ncbi:hypothetical protein QGN29_08420 [Temperatibacter marinus]|uniref:Lipoprotein n=1 Tax=Temperatibacter marinus TaxID=1456591 RepID=A0AA52H9F4_9PROT|nr:hypothetical protein [Temperatibacter marinus]WND01583.1 hypothetical protein QGN29_08420 [Temperatibacter marinus]
MKKLLLISSAFFALTACGGRGDDIVFDKVLGPETQIQLKSLPKDLRGDQNGENLSGQQLKAPELEKDGK